MDNNFSCHIRSRLKDLPRATFGLIFVNILIFTISSVTGNLEVVNETLGLQPVGVLGGQVYRIFTSMFLHADLVHLLSNLLALMVFGYILEKKIGSKEFLAIYFLAHFGAGMIDIAVRPESWVAMYGASAAIFGIAGASFIRYPKEKIPLAFALFIFASWLGLAFLIVLPLTPEAYLLYVFIYFSPVFAFVFAPFVQVPLLPPLVIWVFLQMGLAIYYTNIGYMPSGWWAHLSGFLAGMILAFYSITKKFRKSSPVKEIPAIR